MLNLDEPGSKTTRNQCSRGWMGEDGGMEGCREGDGWVREGVGWKKKQAAATLGL